VKTSILAILALFFTADLTAQVIFRNDFVITDKKQHRLRNRGITAITINLGRYPNWNQLINGRGGRTMVVDVLAVRGKTQYSYSEIAEKIYMPRVFTGPITRTVPVFLLIPNRRSPLVFEMPTRLHSLFFPVLQ
jgi:hypothetical protein